MKISRITVIRVYLDVTATLAGGGAATVTGIDVALLPIGQSVSSGTVWTATTYAAGTGHILILGSDVTPVAGGLVVPITGAVLWRRVVDTPEVDVSEAERFDVAA